MNLVDFITITWIVLTASLNEGLAERELLFYTKNFLLQMCKMDGDNEKFYLNFSLNEDVSHILLKQNLH